MIWRRDRALRSTLAPVAAIVLLCSCSSLGGEQDSACPEEDVTASSSGETVSLDLRSTYHPGSRAGRDVTVTAMVSSAHGGPLERAGRCTRGDVTLHATSPSVPNQPGSVTEGHVDLVTGAGEGDIELVENATWNRENDLGNGMAELRGFTGWYVTFVDPVPGTYRWSSDVTWTGDVGTDEVGDGRVDLVLVATG